MDHVLNDAVTTLICC